MENEAEERRASVGLADIIIKKDKVLLGLRKGSHGDGQWAFPGGHIKFGESFKDCFFRELEEETGLSENNILLFDNYPKISTSDIFKKENKHYITLFMRGLYNNGEVSVKEPDRCEKWRWFYWGKFPDNLFLPIKNLIKIGYSPFPCYSQ